MIAFGFSGVSSPVDTLGKLFCEVAFSQSEGGGIKEAEALIRLENEECQAIALAPLQKGLFDPDTVAIFGNPAQVMRLIQSFVFMETTRISGNFGGKVECTEYLIAPFKTGLPRIAIPGMGDRIFSMTQDDEMVFSIPGQLLASLVEGMKEAGKKIGARYPVTHPTRTSSRHSRNPTRFWQRNWSYFNNITTPHILVFLPMGLVTNATPHDLKGILDHNERAGIRLSDDVL